MIGFVETEVEASQSQGTVKLTVKRKEQTKGKIAIPWKIVPETADSVYVDVKGIYTGHYDVIII